MTENSKNYYEVLEVPIQASAEEIHQGYIRAKNAYSQDSLALYSLMSKEECDKVIELIDEAYSILSDPAKRRMYDDARGLNPGLNYNVPASPTPAAQESDRHSINQAADTTGKQSMTKIVAAQKYGLNFEKNENFEKEIEQASEFTGELLQKIREYKKVDIVRMAEMTKVSKTYIRYIEGDEFDKLPAPVYVRGFVYQYAKCLKLNPELVATSYLFRLKKAKETQV